MPMSASRLLGRRPWRTSRRASASTPSTSRKMPAMTGERAEASAWGETTSTHARTKGRDLPSSTKIDQQRSRRGRRLSAASRTRCWPPEAGNHRDPDSACLKRQLPGDPRDTQFRKARENASRAPGRRALPSRDRRVVAADVDYDPLDRAADKGERAVVVGGDRGAVAAADGRAEPLRPNMPGWVISSPCRPRRCRCRASASGGAHRLLVVAGFWNSAVRTWLPVGTSTSELTVCSFSPSQL